MITVEVLNYEEAARLKKGRLAVFVGKLLFDIKAEVHKVAAGLIKDKLTDEGVNSTVNWTREIIEITVHNAYEVAKKQKGWFVVLPGSFIVDIQHEVEKVIVEKMKGELDTNGCRASVTIKREQLEGGEFAGRIALGLLTSIPQGILGLFLGGATVFVGLLLWELSLQAWNLRLTSNALGIIFSLGVITGVVVGYSSGIVRSVYRTSWWRSIGVLFLGPFVPPLCAGAFCLVGLICWLVVFLVAPLFGYKVLGTIGQWSAVGAFIGLSCAIFYIVVGPFAFASDKK